MHFYSQATLGEIFFEEGFFLTFVRSCHVPKLIPMKPCFDRRGRMSCDWLKSMKNHKVSKNIEERKLLSQGKNKKSNSKCHKEFKKYARPSCFLFTIKTGC